jgi:hypothetical protein
MKASRIITAVVAAGLLLAGQVMAGGGYNIQWNNDGSVNGPNNGYIYTDATGATPLGAGAIIDLVAINGSTLTVLQASALGNDPLALSQNGDPSYAFNITTLVASNALQGVIGQSLGVLVFNGSAEALITPTGGYAVTSPSPNFSTPPLGPVIVELDYASATISLISGPVGSSAGFIDGGAGFFVEVPEPSSFVLVGMGLFGAIGLIRRRRQS